MERLKKRERDSIILQGEEERERVGGVRTDKRKQLRSTPLFRVQFNLFILGFKKPSVSFFLLTSLSPDLFKT